MPRYNHCTRTLDGRILVTINGVQHYMSEPAFVAFMEQALNTMQAIAGCRKAPATKAK